MPSEPPQTGPPPPSEVVGGQLPLEQMAQLLATALRQLREPVASIERGRKLRAQNYDGLGHGTMMDWETRKRLRHG